MRGALSTGEEKIRHDNNPVMLSEILFPMPLMVSVRESSCALISPNISDSDSSTRVSLMVKSIFLAELS